MPLPSTELSADVRALADRLKAASIGQTVSYADLSAAIGRDAQAVRYLVLRALTVANREAGAIFANVRNEGYQRLPATQAHEIGSTTRRRIRKTAKRNALLIQKAIDHANDMPNGEKLRALNEISTLGLLAHLSRDNAQPKPTDISKPEPVAITARRFLERMGVKL